MSCDLFRQGVTDLERAVLADVSAKELWAQEVALYQWRKESGTEGEAKASAYLADVLTSYGLDVTTHQFDLYLSYPVSASLEVIEPVSESIPCITHSFSANTPPGGLVAELVNNEAADVAGKIVLVPNMALPGPIRTAQRRGAAAGAFIYGEVPHELIVSTVWATPTPESKADIPRIPAISLKRPDALRLRQLAAEGRVVARLKTQTDTGWRQVPLVDATLRGASDPEKYILFSGHLDAWYEGATDNGTANVAMVEVARVLSRVRDRLGRTVRFAFWPGHSNGRYAGSTWLADNHWQELHDHCVMNVKIEAPGQVGAEVQASVQMMMEASEFALEIIERITGRRPKPKRFSRDGDLPFWGIGVPALYGAITRPPHEVLGELLPGEKQRHQPWYWHTAFDTLDKVDPQILERDTRIWASTCLRLANAPVLPLDFTVEADALLGIVGDIQARAGSAFDLGEVAEKVRELRSATEGFHAALNGLARRPNGAALFPVANQALMGVGRALSPGNYSLAGQFGQDPAAGLKPWPALQPAADMAALDPRNDDFGFLRTKMVRERNRVLYGLRGAIGVLQEATRALSE